MRDKLNLPKGKLLKALTFILWLAFITFFISLLLADIDYFSASLDKDLLPRMLAFLGEGGVKWH